jgi:iron complex transport system substrate-binding protein
VCAVVGYPATARGSYPRIVTPDWAAAESLLAVGVIPVAVADTPVYREWLPEIPLPSEVLDLGSRAEPNLELIASLRPDRILMSNWQANLIGQFEQIAPTETIAIIDPPASPLKGARLALRQVAQPIGRASDVARYLGNFDNALKAYAQTPRNSDNDGVVIGVLHENGRQLYAYGEGSWVHEILFHLGLRNALKAPTTRFGNALIDLAQLAASPDAHLLYIDQGDRTRRAERALHQSTLWQNLPMVRAGRVHRIPAFYALGGVPSVWRAARIISTTLLDVAGPAND